MSSSFFHVFGNDIQKVTVSAATKNALRSQCLEMTAFNVGSGEAIFLRRNKQVILVDGGAEDDEENVPLGNFLADQLTKHQRKFKLAAFIATHPHTDHLNAIVPMLHRGGTQLLAPGAIYYENGEEYPNALQKNLVPLLESPSKGFTRARVTQAGTSFTFATDVKIKLFVNGREKPDPPYKSIYMAVKFGQASFLFTGDSYIAYENELLDSDHKDDLPADVLKITHHGSKYGTGGKFAEKVNARIAVASTSAKKDHTLKQEVKDHLTDKGNHKCEIRDTFTSGGNVIIRTDGKSRKIGGNDGVLYEIAIIKPGGDQPTGNS